MSESARRFGRAPTATCPSDRSSDPPAISPPPVAMRCAYGSISSYRIVGEIRVAGPRDDLGERRHAVRPTVVVRQRLLATVGRSRARDASVLVRRPLSRHASASTHRNSRYPGYSEPASIRSSSSSASRPCSRRSALSARRCAAPGIPRLRPQPLGVGLLCLCFGLVEPAVEQQHRRAHRRPRTRGATVGAAPPPFARSPRTRDAPCQADRSRRCSAPG